MLNTEKHPFKGRGYFTDSLLYQDSLEIGENLQPEEPDFSNEADTEPETEEKYLWKINPLVTNVDKLYFNTTANAKGEWFINEDLNLVYFSTFAIDSIPSDASTRVDCDQWSAVDALTLLRVLIKLSFMVRGKISDA